MNFKINIAGRLCRGLLPVCIGLTWSAGSWGQLPPALVEKLDSYPHATSVARSETQVRDHEIGLGAMQKKSGVWRFKNSERHSGLLRRHTWQIIDGFTSLEVLTELVTELEAMADSELLFACEGRSCGQGVQWANRVFGERVLYGLEELQRYRVYSLKAALKGPVEYRVILYSSARTADRQYLHMETLQIDSATNP